MGGTVVDAAWRVAYRLAYPPHRALLHCLRRGGPGALVAIRSADEVLVVRHSYRPRLDFVGGGVTPGEDPEACVAREALEEVGVVIPKGALRRLGMLRVDFSGPNSRNHLFEWRVDRLPAVRIDHRELIWAGGIRPRDVPRADRGLALRWYLRRFAPDLDDARPG